MENFRLAFIDLNKRLGGGQIALSNAAYSLAERGHEVHILFGLNKIPKRIKELLSDNCYFYKIPGYNSIYDLRYIEKNTKKFLNTLYKKNKFDVIHAQGLNGLLVPEPLKDYLILMLHGNNLKRGLVLLQSLYQRPEIFKAALTNSKYYLENLFGHCVYGNLERISCIKSKLVIALTPVEKSYAKKYYRVDENKIRVVPNAIISSCNEIHEGPELPEDKKIILSVGALEIIKGIPLLVKVIEYVLKSKKDTIYVSVGDGPLMPMLQNLAKKYPKRVFIYPYLSKGIFSLYSRSTLFVHGSLFEAFGLSIGEAMLAGKPIVAFNIASIPNLVTDNVTGLLAKPLCLKDFATNILQLLEDEEKARRIGQEARTQIEKKYSSLAVGSQLESVIKEV